MDKRKILVIIGLLTVSLIGITTIVNAAIDSSNSNIPSAFSGLVNRILNTTTAIPTTAQLTQINNGTFIDDTANACPPVPKCGTANAPLTATCPDVCYVKVDVNGLAAPTNLPYSGYPKCPEGYAEISLPATDILYSYQIFDSVWPSTMYTYYNLLDKGYTCQADPNGSTYTVCPDSNTRDTGDIWIQDNFVAIATADHECYSSGLGCDWGTTVACDFNPHDNGTTYKFMFCDKPEGYYPTEATLPTGYTATTYKMAGTALICGHIKTEWVNGM